MLVQFEHQIENRGKYMSDNIQTTWMWHDEASNGTMGAILNPDEQKIQWVDQPGCACGDNIQLQAFQDFLTGGAITPIPQDIDDEMHTSITHFLSRML